MSAMSRITIHDVSKAAGVSIKTVSRVLNSEPNVRSETRARVLKLVEELNYHPSLSARSLAGRSSNLIGLIYQNPSANYVVDLQKGALERCHTRGYRLLVHPCEGADRLERARSRRPRARIAPRRRGARAAAVGLHRSAGRTAEASHPFRAHRAHRRSRRVLVRVHERRRGRARDDRIPHRPRPRAHRLHQWPAQATRSPSSATSATRWRCARTASTSIRSSSIAANSRSTPGLAAARRLLSRATRPTAVFASNDDMAAGTIMAAHEMGLSIPNRLSVAGFDDSYVAQVIWPRLTTVHQPTYEMAHQAADMLFRSLGDEELAEEHRDSLPHGVPRIDRTASGELVAPPLSTARCRRISTRSSGRASSHPRLR